MRFPLLFVFAVLLMMVQGQANAQDATNNYETVITNGDKYFADHDYINAKASYQYALRMRPDSMYPKTRIKMTLERLRQQMDLSGDYTAYIAQANQHLDKDEFDQAIASLQKKAQSILPNKKNTLPVKLMS